MCLDEELKALRSIAAFHKATELPTFDPGIFGDRFVTFYTHTPHPHQGDYYALEDFKIYFDKTVFPSGAMPFRGVAQAKYIARFDVHARCARLRNCAAKLKASNYHEIPDQIEKELLENFVKYESAKKVKEGQYYATVSYSGTSSSLSNVTLTWNSTTTNF